MKSPDQDMQSGPGLGSQLIYTVFYLITAHTPTSAQSSNFVVFRLQPVYFFVYFFIKAYVVGTYLNCIDLSMNRLVDAIQMGIQNICFYKENQIKIA